ncbi:amine oxidase [Tricladium varicosporioides]|nr:amine oxidase [Hymenoscyphus varicosporioides]
MAQSQATSRPHVCVVGAGISGLRCATLLIDAGYEVTIIEARDRIGGRIWQSNEFGYPLDMGPNWINTTTGGEQAIMKLAQKTNTPLHLYSDDVRVFASNGEEVEPTRALHLQVLIWDIFKSSFEFSAKNTSEISIWTSLLEHVQSCIRKSDVSEEDRELLTQLCKMWGNYTGDPIHRQSLKYAWTESVCGGDAYYVTTDFSSILAHAAEAPLQHANIQLETKVIGARTKCDKQAKVEVKLLHGTSQYFDEVVLTTPLGWLKKNQRIFEPPLGPEIRSAINNISVGHLEKVYIAFNEAFWRKSSRDHEPYIDHMIWLAPEYSLSTNPSQWSMAAYDLAAFTPEQSRPVLIFYIFGDLATHVTAIVRHNEDKSIQNKLLDDFFHPYYSRLPNYSSTNPHCKSKGFLATQWQFDDLAGYGSYCNLQVGIDGADRYIHVLQDGEPAKGIWFAGEHVAPVEERGTVGGAWISGESTARRIVAKYSPPVV